MLYRLLKIPAKIAIHFYCRSIRINNKAYLHAEGPLLIAANHPNSFLDAVILATLFKKPIYSLTRGDMYKKPFVSKILHAMKMFPVFRMSEGVENLEQNYQTFEKCKDVFRKNGIVLIFSEGLCQNEWHLRPMKKGTARLAISSWQENIPLKILPTGLNYSAFKLFSKNILLNFGDIIHEEDIDHTNGYGKTISDFNQILTTRLGPLVVELPQHDKAVRKKKFYIRQPLLKKIILGIPAVAGYLLHAPLYTMIKRYTESKAGGTGHFDSIIVAILFAAYPLYLLLLCLLVWAFSGPAWLVFIILPFCAWSYVHLKRQV